MVCGDSCHVPLSRPIEPSSEMLLHPYVYPQSYGCADVCGSEGSTGLTTTPLARGRVDKQ